MLPRTPFGRRVRQNVAVAASFHARSLNPLKGALLDLPDPLARDLKLDTELAEGARRIEKPTPLKDLSFSIIKYCERHAQRLLPDLRLLAFDNMRFLIGSCVHQPILPFAGIAIFVQWCIERDISVQPAVHLDDLLFADVKFFSYEKSPIGPQIAHLESGELVLRLAQIEEQLSLIDCRTNLHERPRTTKDYSLGSLP